MKNKNIIKGMLFAGVALMFGGCSSDYLDLAPESQPSRGELAESLTAARLAVLGIAQSMNTQYDATSINQFNGEAYINTCFSEGMAQDCYVGLNYDQFGSSMMKWDLFGENRGIMNAMIWMYCYNLINQTNAVLDVIDGVPLTGNETEEMRNFIKAQALTYRAHAYIKLLQYYAPRWEDSNNGATYCIVIRETQEMTDLPLSTMAEVKTALYKDLDTALECYDKAKSQKRTYKWEPDKTIAQGLYARAAMIFHDWDVAETMAHDAQEGYSVMDNETLFAGFYKDNNDFMWEQSSADNDIYYWSWGSHYAVNGGYVNNWGMGGLAISLDLYNQLDPNDVRRDMFLTPDKTKTVGSTINIARLKPEDFWNKDLVQSSNCDMSIGATVRDRNKPDLKWGLVNMVVKYGLDYMDNKFTGDLNEVVDKEDPFCCYFKYGKSVAGGFRVTQDLQALLKRCQIGSSYKFWSIAPYGASTYPFMRNSEMILTEAEAAYMAGHYTQAQTALNKIKTVRIPGYAGSNSGQALLDEIRLERRIELWGEGFGFTDLKRWNLPMVRRAWVVNDPTSGNIGASYAVTRNPNEQAGWRLMVPLSESDYNKAIDTNLLPKASEYTSKGDDADE